MLTLKQIDKAITSMLLTQYPDIDVVETDVSEGFERPSFHIVMDNLDRDTRLHYSIRSMTVRIYYFPSDRYTYQLEILEMQQDLESIFNLNFAVEDRVITIDETRGQIIDGILEFEFDFTYHEDNQKEDTADKMQELMIDV